MKQPIRIAINLISLHNSKSVGSFLYIRRLLQELEQKDLSDFRFTVYMQKHLNPKELGIPNHKSFQIVYVPTLHTAGLRILFEQTLFYFYLKPCDISFTHVLSLPLFAPGKRVYVIHDLVPFVIKQHFKPLKGLYIRLMTRLALKFANGGVITVSENSKKDLERILGVKAIGVVKNFIPDTEILTQQPSSLTIQALNGRFGKDFLSSPFFVCVSSLHAYKNIEAMIRAFAIFRDKYPGYKLYFVGSKGWGYESMIKQVECLHLENAVQFTGYLNEEELAALYVYCQGVFYGSLYEGFGIPPLEGFVHGKSCVVSNAASLPEVVGNAGVLVNPHSIEDMAEGLEKFVETKADLSLQIPAQLAKFDGKKESQKFLDLLRNL